LETNRLTTVERSILENLLQAKPLYARRARLLLAWDDGLPPAALAEQTPLSPARVRYWLSRFALLRLQVFPPKVLAAVRAPTEGDETAQSHRDTEEEKGDTDVIILSEAAAYMPQNLVPDDNETLHSVQGDETPVILSEAAAYMPQNPVPGDNETLRSVQGERTAPRPTKPGLLPSDPMAEAGRKVLRFHFMRMLDHESGARAGQDIEHLHDMRVATRRLRAAFVLFGDYYAPMTISYYVKYLRRIGRALGAVRDLDVFLEKARGFLATLPDAEQSSLDPLLASWQANREQARRQMLALLDSPRYQGFCRAFDLFTSTPGLGASTIVGAPKEQSAQPAPLILAYIAPTLVYQRLAEVRAFEPLLPSAPVTLLHQLRIACKRLRYTLEFLEETLGAEAKEVIKEVVVMQDHLGNLQDAVVATDLLRGFLNEWAERQKSDGAAQQVDIHGVTQYLAMKQAETIELLRAFPAAWQRLSDPRLREKLARALGAL
jgi:CHAD domain-containing protein